MHRGLPSLVIVGSLLAGVSLADEPSTAPLTIEIRRAPGPIVVDGELGDAGWADATPIETWYQMSPGSGSPPRVRTVGWMAFDDGHLYVAMRLDDPNPAQIRAPLTERDNGLQSSDYAGIIIDGLNDRKTAQEFLVNPRGVQYDLIWSDILGDDDMAPNFHWRSAARITATGWNVEIAIPFSSIRYAPGPRPVWGVTLFRNWPRDRRYQIATATQPTGSCFICNENQLVGLENLPKGGSWTLAPYVVGRRSDRPREGVLGAPLEPGDETGEAGFDLKWNPSPRHVVDLALRPDFSQVETDEPQIATNQRFALFYPERRPFFLEQIDLFSTPLSAVYTRTVTDPRAGLRATGRFGRNAYTLLVAQDDGGGSVVIPGSTSSSIVEQDFESTVSLGRFRHDLGPSAQISFLVTDREIDGGGFNRVVGPDFQWTRGDTDTVTGQVLWSRSETPDRPDLTPEWDGRTLSGSATILSWDHSVGSWYWSLEGRDVDGEFRADNGYVPRVGYRSAAGELGRGWGRKGWLSGFRLYAGGEYARDENDEVLSRVVDGGVSVGGERFFGLRLEARSEDQQVESQLLHQSQGRLFFRIAPSGSVANLIVRAYAGSVIDLDNVREGDGWGASLEAALRSRRHFELRVNAARNVLDVDPPGSASGRLFTADVVRLKAVWTFTPRFYVRYIVQLRRTERNPTLYTFPVEAKSEDVTSSLLIAYKLDWQSVFYLGYGEGQTFLADSSRREKSSREIFVKISYALRH